MTARRRHPPQNVPATAHGYLALGDSYTIGEGVAAEDTWPHRLARALAGPLDKAEPVVVATTGWTTGELLAALEGGDGQRARAAAPHALVSLLIGVNNQYRGQAAESHLADFQRLLDGALGYAGGNPRRVLVVSIPDWGVTPFAGSDARSPAAIARAIDQYNALQARTCRERGIVHVDITPISRRCAGDASLFAADGLHPSASQYALWLPPILAAAQGLLEA